MPRLLTLLTVLLAVLPSAAASASSGTAREPFRMTAQSGGRQLAKAEENSCELLQRCFAAGGIDDPLERQRLQARFDKWVGPLARDRHQLTERALAAKIFRNLHGELLSGKYRSECSSVAVALDTGDFNCLSSTILYLCAARRCGVRVVPLASEGHVLCRLDDGTAQNVETTCPDWFERLANRRAGQPRIGPPECSSLAAHGARPRYDDLRPLSDAQLLAKVYYNRGVELLRSERFEEGLVLTRQSLDLDPEDRLARGNILAGLNNWALQLALEGEHEEALARLEELRLRDSQYASLPENELHIRQLWADNLCRRQRFADALEVLEAGQRNDPQRKLYETRRQEITKAWQQALAAPVSETSAAQ